MNKLTFNQLPKDVQDKAKETLGAFTKCYVEYDKKSNRYDVSTCVGLHEGDYKEWIGEYHVKDAFTTEAEYIEAHKLQNYGYAPSKLDLKRLFK